MRAELDGFLHGVVQPFALCERDISHANDVRLAARRPCLDDLSGACFAAGSKTAYMVAAHAVADDEKLRRLQAQRPDMLNVLHAQPRNATKYIRL